MTALKCKWTDNYHGISHLGRGTKEHPRWATITRWSGFTEVRLWFRYEDSFTMKHRSVLEVFRVDEHPKHEAAAKKRGEDWVAGKFELENLE